MRGRRKSFQANRAKLRSPGRPGVGRRADRLAFWKAIAAGRSSEDAGQCAGVSGVVGLRWFREGGGMPPSHLRLSAPVLSGRYLSFAEREEIALRRAMGHGVRTIARELGRAASTVSRELRRNAATRSGGFQYRATTAQWHADRAARRPKVAKLAMNAPLRHYVQERLAGMVRTADGTAIGGPTVPWKGRRHGRRQHRRWAQAWSPAQIANRLPLDFPGDPAMRISHEAIYQALYVQGRGAATGADGLPAHGTCPSDATCTFAEPRQILCHARGADQRTACIGRGSRGARTLGGRSDPGAGEFGDRHAG